MRAIELSRVISRLRNVLGGSIKAQIEGFDTNFHISNKNVYTSDVDYRVKCSFPIKAKCL